MPEDSAALRGRIIAGHGRHYTVELEDGSLRKCFPRGKKGDATVGDYVCITPQGHDEGAIERIEPRRNLLFRSDEMRSKQFAANVDQLLIIVATDPLFSEDLLGRALVAAWSADIAPIIVLNKTDISDKLDAARDRLKDLRALNVAIVEISALRTPVVHEKILPLLKDKTTLLLGQSAMGKSTLLNALVPLAQAPTQEHSKALGAGKHTTTSTRLYHLPNGSGDIIDSPGFQAFGLFHLGATDIERGFPEFTEAISHCRFYNCTHKHEPGCGVLAALERKEIAPARHALYLRILAENEARNRY